MINPNQDMEMIFVGQPGAPTFSQDHAKGKKATIKYTTYTDAQGRQVEEEEMFYQRRDRANRKQAKNDKRRARKQK